MLAVNDQEQQDTASAFQLGPQPKSFFLNRDWIRTDHTPKSPARKTRIFEDKAQVTLEFSTSFQGSFGNQRLDASYKAGFLELSLGETSFIISGGLNEEDRRVLHCEIKGLDPRGEGWDAEEDDDGTVEDGVPGR